MSKQWGHGFHHGRKAQMIDTLTREKGIHRWINYLREGKPLTRRDWDSDTKVLFMRNGSLFVNDDGIVAPYEIDELDMVIEWFGFFDQDDIDI